MKKDYRTQYRSWILNYFEKHGDDMIPASEVFSEMRKEGLSINQATVYRNLDRLEESGKIRGHKLNRKEEKFYQYLEPGHDCSHHLHLYCKRCGKVIHLDCSFMNEIEDHLMKEHGFLLDCSDSVLVGLCETCREKENTQ